VPLAVALSLLAGVAVARLDPEAARVAVNVGLPAGWNYTVVLALPEIVRLLGTARSRLRLVLVVVAAASFGAPLASAALRLWSAVLPWSGDSAPPVAAILTAVQPAGFVGLLLLSVTTAAVKPRL
jgi:hypothetical protein